VKKTGFEQTPIKELRQLLCDKAAMPMESLLGLKKSALVELYLQTSNKEIEVEYNIGDTNEQHQEQHQEQQQEPVNDMTELYPNEEEFVAVDLDTLEPTEDQIIDVEAIKEAAKIPTPLEKGWTDYLMSLLREDEIFDKRPTCDGLRRLVEELVGPILGREVVILNPPTKDNNMTASIVVRLSVNSSGDFWGNRVITEEDVGDAGPFNSDPPFDKYPSSLAMTRAEGRCLRRILRMKTITSEEGSKRAEEMKDSTIASEWCPTDKISPEQKTVIDLIAKQCDIDAWAFINSGTQQYISIDDINKDTASKMIQHLNTVRQDKAVKPTGVGSYKENWLL
jgi:hypothetical protein